MDSCKINDTITITHHCHGDLRLPDNYEGLSGTVIKIFEDGSIMARLLYHNTAFGVSETVVLQPGNFEISEFHTYGVTVERTGYIEVAAASDEQAMLVVNLFAKAAEVSWTDNWDATDAELIRL